MKIFGHTDMDGRACLAVMGSRYPDAKLIFYNYWYDNKIFDDVKPGERVVFVDITPRMEALTRIMEITNDITILDHHSSSIRMLKEANLTFPGKMIEDGQGACKLAWEYAYPDKPIPRGIQYIAEYDNWERTHDNQKFYYGIHSFNTFPTNNIWDSILVDNELAVTRIMDIGKTVMSYIIPFYKRLVNSYSIVGLVDNLYPAILLNQGAVDSAVFDSLKESYDVYARVVMGKDLEWLVSVTTKCNDIDLSLLADKFSGGGHAKSSGFRVKHLSDFFNVQDTPLWDSIQ